jgi:hypothetical protein
MATPPTGEPLGRPSNYRPEYCDLIIAEMAKGYSLGACAATIGCARSTINEWVSRYPDFSEAVKLGLSHRQKQWETAAMQSAFTGGAGNVGMITMGLRNAGREDWSEPEHVKHAVTITLDRADTEA